MSSDDVTLFKQGFNVGPSLTPGRYAHPDEGRTVRCLSCNHTYKAVVGGSQRFCPTCKGPTKTGRS